MPLYDFRCEAGHKFDRLLKIAQRADPQQCACGAFATRLISRPRIHVEHVEYDCPITGKMITSKQAHEENLKVHGCRLYEPGETDAAERRIVDGWSSLDAAIDKAVEVEWEAMPSVKRERLTNEIEHGIDLQYERAK